MRFIIETIIIYARHVIVLYGWYSVPRANTKTGNTHSTYFSSAKSDEGSNAFQITHRMTRTMASAHFPYNILYRQQCHGYFIPFTRAKITAVAVFTGTRYLYTAIPTKSSLLYFKWSTVWSVVHCLFQAVSIY